MVKFCYPSCGIRPFFSSEQCVFQDLPHVLNDVAMPQEEEDIKTLNKMLIDFSRTGW